MKKKLQGYQNPEKTTEKFSEGKLKEISTGRKSKEISTGKKLKEISTEGN